MKTSPKKSETGLTLVEIFIVIAVLAILAGFLLPRMRVSSKAPRITCVNNLKQVGLSFRIYAGDNGDRYPMNISTNSNPVVNEATPLLHYFKLIENELGTPKITVCPSDNQRSVATNFTHFSTANISYFVGLDSNENIPGSMVTGDRNITNGFPPVGGILRLTAKQKVRFTKEIHLEQGNVALGDGSVQQVSSARLRSEIIPNTGFATNRILLP